jgi:hypothetical protein
VVQQVLEDPAVEDQELMVTLHLLQHLRVHPIPAVVVEDQVVAAMDQVVVVVVAFLS